MSKYNNVNPGQYKVGGRERPDTLAKERLKDSSRAQTKKASRGAAAKRTKKR